MMWRWSLARSQQTSPSARSGCTHLTAIAVHQRICLWQRQPRPTRKAESAVVHMAILGQNFKKRSDISLRSPLRMRWISTTTSPRRPRRSTMPQTCLPMTTRSSKPSNRSCMPVANRGACLYRKMMAGSGFVARRVPCPSHRCHSTAKLCSDETAQGQQYSLYALPRVIALWS